MLNLVDVDTVRSRLALPDDVGIVETIESALAGAKEFIEAKLNSKTEAGSAADWFRVDAASVAYHNTFHLRLSNGFLSGDAVVTASFDMDGSNAEAWTIYTQQYEKGILIIPVPEGVPTFFKVEYDYGYSRTRDVPVWVQEVALSYVVQLMSMQQINDSKKELSNIYKFVESHRTQILDAHLRKDSFAITPFA